MSRKDNDMDVIEMTRESVATLATNKMRTGLAMLGIIIGIGSVIALISLGQSSQKAVTEQIQSLGANLLTIMPGAIRTGNVRGAQGGITTLTNADALAIENLRSGNVAAVSAEVSRRTQVSTGSNNANTQVIGATSMYQKVHKIELSAGVFISETDNMGMTRVAVLGPELANTLFGQTDVVGNSIRISGKSFKVVGLTKAKGGSGFNNLDDMVYIPLSVAQRQVFGINYLTGIAVEVVSQDRMVDAQNKIGYLLLGRHNSTDPAQADFSIFSQQDILNTASATTTTFTTLLSGVAAISLLVGGIGIMNIMLVTVTERTREIGLLKALGATKKTVTTQFLIEAILLTVTGGTIGILVGVLASVIILRITNSPFSLSLASMGLAFGVSAIIGIVFGWYPARQAAKLQPIEALRYE